MRNHYPAIDVLGSVSRLMNDIAGADQLGAAAKIRRLMAAYEANYDLVSIGAYKPGTNPELDEAIARMDRINGFLRQGTMEKVSYQETLDNMKEAIG